MTAVKMPHINVGPQVSADVYKGDGSGPMRMARGYREGQKWHFSRIFFMDKPVSRNLSRNLSRQNAKPQPAAKIAASQKLSRNLC